MNFNVPAVREHGITDSTLLALPRRAAGARLVLRRLRGRRAAPGRGAGTEDRQARPPRAPRPLTERSPRRGRWGQHPRQSRCRWLRPKAPRVRTASSCTATAAYACASRPRGRTAPTPSCSTRWISARLCALVPPPRFHIIRYHGVLAAHSSARAEVVLGREPPS
ncbi:MAG: transposase [Sandaracinaceae bacterium]|nr:transposase [Sandaracinaceae bacterium]